MKIIADESDLSCDQKKTVPTIGKRRRIEEYCGSNHEAMRHPPFTMRTKKLIGLLNEKLIRLSVKIDRLSDTGVKGN